MTKQGKPCVLCPCPFVVHVALFRPLSRHLAFAAPAVELSGNLNTAEGLETARRACSIIRNSNPSKNVSTLQPYLVSYWKSEESG